MLVGKVQIAQRKRLVVANVHELVQRAKKGNFGNAAINITTIIMTIRSTSTIQLMQGCGHGIVLHLTLNRSTNRRPFLARVNVQVFLRYALTHIELYIHHVHVHHKEYGTKE
jgi:hypothetical protein